MIDAALGLLAGQLNLHLRRCFDLTEDLVVLSNLHEQSGALVPSVSNKLVMFLSGIERETIAHRSVDGGARTSGYASLPGPAPVYLNLLLMCAANFSGTNYPEALKCLAYTITFFQGKPVFDHSNAPEMDEGLERLVLNIENLSSSEMHSLWGIHSGRYLPSVLYRVRMVSLDAQHIARRDPLVQQTDIRVVS
jgi:hypothetical protein